MSCEKGEIIGLIERKGSGKSTLLKIIFGTEKPDSKFIRIADKVIRKISDGKNLINYLAQDNFLPNNTSIKSIINLFFQRKYEDILLKNKYMKPLLDKQNQDLSSGEKRTIEFLLIIHSKAEYVLLDEPFNGLSPIMRDYIIDFIKRMKSSKGCNITDQDYENLIGLADSIIYLQNGFLKEITNEKELIGLGYLLKTSYI